MEEKISLYLRHCAIVKDNTRKNVVFWSHRLTTLKSVNYRTPFSAPMAVNMMSNVFQWCFWSPCLLPRLYGVYGAIVHSMAIAFHTYFDGWVKYLFKTSKSSNGFFTRIMEEHQDTNLNATFNLYHSPFFFLAKHDAMSNNGSLTKGIDLNSSTTSCQRF
jgi:hypothetical protein